MSKKKINEKSLKNLKPFKSGGDWTGNAGGRPKKRPITDEYFQLADQVVPEKIRKRLEKKWEIKLEPGITFSKANALRRYLDAMESGGQTSSKEIREAIEGKAPERLEITGPERKEITIHLIHTEKKAHQ